ncbi:MAG: hypothetical protein JXR03_20705 [Cyclobacteriaceae bacterium]
MSKLCLSYPILFLRAVFSVLFSDSKSSFRKLTKANFFEAMNESEQIVSMLNAAPEEHTMFSKNKRAI